MLAMVGCGRFDSVQQAARTLVEVERVVEPDRALTERYQERYEQFRAIYPACRTLFPKLLAED